MYIKLYIKLCTACTLPSSCTTLSCTTNRTCMDFVYYGVNLKTNLWSNSFMYKWQNDVSYDCLLKEFTVFRELIVNWLLVD